MKYVLITGANGGLASAIIDDLLLKSEFVIGLDITSSKRENENYVGLVCDVTKDEDVNNAYEEVKKITDHLDVVINVAGIMTFGSVIEIEPEVMHKMLNVNLCGMYRINYTFMPLIEKERGRIINFSSEYGKYTSVPFNGLYTTTKYAVEAYSEALRRELKYIGIPVVIVRPGAFATNMQKSTYEIFERLRVESKHYKEVLNKLAPMLDEGNKKTKDPHVLSKKVMKAVYAKKPKRVYKKNHNFSMKLLSKMPTWLIDFIFYKLF